MFCSQFDINIAPIRQTVNLLLIARHIYSVLFPRMTAIKIQIKFLKILTSVVLFYYFYLDKQIYQVDKNRLNY